MSKSQLTIGRSFWLASVLIFFSAIRRELSFLPELFIPDGFIFFNQTYDWWEDSVLLIIILVALAALIYGWRYLWAVLKGVSKPLYIIVGILVIIQYLAEHSIGFSHSIGSVVEEVAEGIIYLIALVYLWRFPLAAFDEQLESGLDIDQFIHAK